MNACILKGVRKETCTLGTALNSTDIFDPHSKCDAEK